MGIDTYKAVFSTEKGPYAVHIAGKDTVPVKKASLTEVQAEFWFAAANPGPGYTARLLNRQILVKEKQG
jgi:uncharacterized protein YccT (UPF0319 family)